MSGPVVPFLQRQRALAFMQCLDARDYSKMESLMSPTFRHRFLPASLGGFGLRERTKNQYLQYLRSQEPLFEYLSFRPPLEIIETYNVVVIHSDRDGKTASGAQYMSESVFMFHFDNDRVDFIKEFVDSKYVTDVLGAVHVNGDP